MRLYTQIEFIMEEAVDGGGPSQDVGWNNFKFHCIQVQRRTQNTALLYGVIQNDALSIMYLTIRLQ